jgi:hypothetical protein
LSSFGSSFSSFFQGQTIASTSTTVLLHFKVFGVLFQGSKCLPLLVKPLAASNKHLSGKLLMCQEVPGLFCRLSILKSVSGSFLSHGQPHLSKATFRILVLFLSRASAWLPLCFFTSSAEDDTESHSCGGL